MQVLDSGDLDAIRALHEREEFFWLDLLSPGDHDLDELGKLLAIPDLAVEDTRSSVSARSSTDVLSDSARAHRSVNVLINQMAGRLTIVATIFLPLTFATGFFGMNFGWLVSHISSAEAFLALGVGGMILPLVIVAVLLVRSGYLERR